MTIFLGMVLLDPSIFRCCGTWPLPRVQDVAIFRKWAAIFWKMESNFQGNWWNFPEKEWTFPRKWCSSACSPANDHISGNGVTYEKILIFLKIGSFSIFGKLQNLGQSVSEEGRLTSYNFYSYFLLLTTHIPFWTTVQDLSIFRKIRQFSGKTPTSFRIPLIFCSPNFSTLKLFA